MKKDIEKLLKKIPKGKVTTYKELAGAVGIHPRAIGRILNSNERLVKIPCHRVVMSNGRVGGYKLGVKKKIELLKREGIEIENGKILNFENKLFKIRK